MPDSDRITEQNFKVDAEGRLIFYPYGMYGKGRILPDRAAAGAVYTRQKRLMAIALGAAVALSGAYLSGLLSLAWIVGIAAVLCVVLGVAVRLSIHPLVRDLPTTDEEFDFGDSIQGDGRSRLHYLLWASFVFVLVGVLMSLFGKGEQRWIGVACVVFFGAGFVALGWQAVALRRRRSASAVSKPVQRMRKPRDSVTVARKPEGFGKRQPPPDPGP
jgi:hypothetical protein